MHKDAASASKYHQPIKAVLKQRVQTKNLPWDFFWSDFCFFPWRFQAIVSVHGVVYCGLIHSNWDLEFSTAILILKTGIVYRNIYKIMMYSTIDLTESTRCPQQDFLQGITHTHTLLLFWHHQQNLTWRWSLISSKEKKKPVRLWYKLLKSFFFSLQFKPRNFLHSFLVCVCVCPKIGLPSVIGLPSTSIHLQDMAGTLCSVVCVCVGYTAFYGWIH